MPSLTKLYSVLEVSQRNTREECLIVIDGKVYDVTPYLDEHPGGDDVLLGAAGGKDATHEFEEAGHSKEARELMESFCVGEIINPSSESTPSRDFSNKNYKIFDNYWAVSAGIVGVSIAVVVSYLWLRKR